MELCLPTLYAEVHGHLDFFGNRAGICAGAVGCHAFQIVVSQTRLADDVTRHGADWNCVRVVLGMGETNCNVASNFDCNHSHDFCALVVAHSLMTASIRQQPIEPFGYLALGDGAARLGHSLALLLSLVAPAQFLAEFLGRLAFDRQPGPGR